MPAPDPSNYNESDLLRPQSTHTDAGDDDGDDDDSSTTLIDEVIDMLQNDVAKVHDVVIVPPPDMQYMLHHDILLNDRLNEDIDLQDALMKHTVTDDTDAAHIRQLLHQYVNIRIHIDGGSNRSVTPDLRLLEDVQDIPPYHMHGASTHDIALTCTKVGTMKIVCVDDAIPKIHTYYAPTANETIVSPRRRNHLQRQPVPHLDTGQ